MNSTSGAHYRSRDDELFFGGPGGYNAFYPERLEFDDQPPAVALTAFLKFNEPARISVLPERLTSVGRPRLSRLRGHI